MLAGIFGAWWARGQAVGIVTTAAAAGDQALARGQELVGQANQYVETGQAEVGKLTAGISKAGAKAEETNLLLVAAEAAFDKDLTPGLERLTERGQDLRETVSVIDQMISVMQRLPGQGDSKLIAIVDNLITTLQSLDQTITDTRDSIKQAKSAGIEKLVTTLMAPLDRATTALTNVSDRLDQADQRLAQGRADLAKLAQDVITALTVAAVVGTLAFLWMALAQLGLFLHAYGVATGRDPLARWHGRDQRKAAVVAQPAA